MTSREKVEQLAEQLLAARAGDMLTRSLMAFAPQLLRRLPDDPAKLDQTLYELAALLVMLRSDDARPLTIRWADDTDPGEPGLALTPGEHVERTQEPAS